MTADRRSRLLRSQSIGLGAIVWAAAMAASAFVALALEQARGTGVQVILTTAFYFAGGLLAYPFAYLAIGIANRRLPTGFRVPFAAAMLGGFTLSATAAVLALDYRIYYSQWHATAFSKVWIYQQIFTALGSTYQYLVIGTRLYWPIGILALVMASLLLARKPS